MAALVADHDPRFADSLRPLRDQAWIAFGLYWEHDWTADGPISRERRAAWQRKIAKQITDYVDALHDLAAKKLGELIGDGEDSPRYFVFNPLAWERTDYVDIEVESERRWSAVEVGSRQQVPSQMIEREGRPILRILASKVPACGYRVFELHQGGGDKASRGSIRFDGRELTSKQHRLRILENGSIDLWHSKTLARTLIGSRGRGNQFEGLRGKVLLESSGDVSTTVRIDVDRGIARTTRITLFESIDRIEIDNTIRENFSGVESWRYDFDLQSPRTFHEEVGAIVRAASNSDGGDYADRNARTDWLTMNHFVTLQDESAAVTISNRDCQFFHLGRNVTDQMESTSSVIHVLAGGQVDGPELGIRNQGGDRLFHQHFALGCSQPSSATPRTDAMRMSLEHQNPLVAGAIAAGSGRLNAEADSLLECESDSVIVWAVKPPEMTDDGEGQGTLVVRLWNLADRPSKYELRRDRPIKSCHKITHVETDIEPLDVTDGSVRETLLPGAMRTLRIR